MGVQQHFSQTYEAARTQFLSAAEIAGLHVQSHLHPLVGRHSESLAMDVLRMCKAQAIRTQYGTPCATLTGQLLADLLHPEALGHAVTPEVRDRARACLGMQTCESTRRAS